MRRGPVTLPAQDYDALMALFHNLMNPKAIPHGRQLAYPMEKNGKGRKRGKKQQRHKGRNRGIKCRRQ